MKKLFYIIITFSLIIAGCKETDYLAYTDINRIQMNDTVTQSFTFVYENASVTQDTVWVQVNTIGNISDKDREVKLIQVPEYNYTYVRDPQTGQITDTVKTEKPNKATPGVHYIDFTDPGLKKFYVIKAKAVTAKLPIVLLRDASLKNTGYRLRAEIAETNDFGLGELKARAKTIIFSDLLERFYSWRFDSSTAPAYSSFGKYSVRKHQFMIDVSGEVIDENWYQAVAAIQALTHYRNLFKAALNTYNADPANIASGKAPMRETTDPGSPLVTFP
jgi:hypothetical protein